MRSPRRSARTQAYSGIMITSIPQGGTALRLSAAMNLGGFRSRSVPANEQFEDRQITATCPVCVEPQTLAQASFIEGDDASEYRCMNGCGSILVRLRHPQGAKMHMDNLTGSPLALDRSRRSAN